MDTIEAVAVAALSSLAIQAKLKSNGFVVPPLGSAEYTAFVAKEQERWVRVIKVASIKEE